MNSYITKEQFFGMYIGTEFIAKDIIQGKLNLVYQEIDTEAELYTNNWFVSSDNETCGTIPIEECKLILRPFEGMSEEETDKLISIDDIGGLNDRKELYRIYYTLQQIAYLISIGIDVFNLKEKGWAVYEEDLK